MADGTRPREHVTTPYQKITELMVDELQRTYLAGGDLYRVAPWMRHEDKRIIVAETLDADRLTEVPSRRLFSDDPGVGPMTDYKNAAMAELILDAPRSATGPTSEVDREEKAMAFLREVTASPTASPMLEYEPLYRDLAESALLNREGAALDWLKRAAKHNLWFNKGDDVVFVLIDLASGYLQLGDLETGLGILTQLLRHDPGNIWVYRFMATGFSVLGLTALGLEAARRGLDLLDDAEDREDLRDELLMAEIELETSPRKGRESEVPAETLDAIREALALDPEAGESKTPEALCEALVPDWDAVPVKEPLRFKMLPEEVRQHMASLGPEA